MKVIGPIPTTCMIFKSIHEPHETAHSAICSAIKLAAVTDPEPVTVYHYDFNTHNDNRWTVFICSLKDGEIVVTRKPCIPFIICHN